jgi:hypothetical protein
VTAFIPRTDMLKRSFAGNPQAARFRFGPLKCRTASAGPCNLTIACAAYSR